MDDLRCSKRAKTDLLEQYDISVEFGQDEVFKMPSCLMNAAGARCTTLGELQHLMDNPWTGAVVSKSCTLNYREGNPQPRYYHEHSRPGSGSGSAGFQPSFSINSTGLANYGLESYIKPFEGNGKKKPYFLSMAGLSLEENLKMLRRLEIHARHDEPEVVQEQYPDFIELNLSCPNIPGKPQTGYDFEDTDETLRRVFEIMPESRMGVKLPPYFDLVHQDMIADILQQYPLSFVTCINSLGNGLVVDWVTETPVIRPKKGFGGLGGKIVKPFALANVRRFKYLLPDVEVIGCGGVQNGWDVFEHLLVGASVVQVGTQLTVEGLGCFERLARELKVLMSTKGYHQISDFQNCLKDFPEPTEEVCKEVLYC